MDKRIYRTGYNIEWNKKQQDSDKRKLTSNYSGKTQIEANSFISKGEFENEKKPASIHRSVLFSSAPVVLENKNTNASGKKIVKNKSGLIFKLENKQNKKANQQPDASGGKSQLVALLLCIFLGILGIHRFYLGYPGIGILMLLTGGVCGILALIDLIRIITGDLKPRNGDYAEKL
jgi:hypothetical protein